MDMKLKDWNRQVNDFMKNPNKFLKPFAIEATFLILHKMAELTIPDTGQSRALVIKNFADKYGYSTADFEAETWDWWGNRERGLRDWSFTQDSVLSESEAKDGVTFKNEISSSHRSFPLFAQNKLGNQVLNHRMPSPDHPRPDRSKYIAHHLDEIADRVNQGDYSFIEGLEELQDRMEKYVAEQIFNGRWIG